MERFKGIIALDIDGTITVSKHSLEEEVNSYLNQLIAEGWRLMFVTGRTFSFARPILSRIEGNYFFAVQNGAALYEMPHEKCLKKRYLPASLLTEINPLFQEANCGLLIESGKENGDICYYNPNDFSEEDLEYVAFRIKISPEKWREANSFGKLPLTDFAVGKYFARENDAVALSAKLLKKFPVSITVIRDPFRTGFHLALVNAQNTSKGSVLDDVASLLPKGGPIIAAGDDYNDVEMLKKSTIKIVMQNGPTELHHLADILAPPAENQGIIQGLQEAIWKVSFG